jgi:hypothetical protein
MEKQMPNRPLFTISADLLALAALLTETGGDVTDADAEAAITAWFAELGAERDAKIDDYCALIRELEARHEARTHEAQRLLALAKTDHGTAQRLRTRLFAFCKAQAITRLTTARFQLGIVRNGGMIPLGYSALPVIIPPDFQKVTIDYDTVAIRKALDAGESLTFAYYLPRGERLSIR